MNGFDTTPVGSSISTATRQPRRLRDISDKDLARLITSLESLTVTDVPLLALRDKRFRALDRAADGLYPATMNEAIRRLVLRGREVIYRVRNGTECRIIGFDADQFREGAFRVIDEHGHTRYAPQNNDAFRDEHADMLVYSCDGQGAQALAAALTRDESETVQ